MTGTGRQWAHRPVRGLARLGTGGLLLVAVNRATGAGFHRWLIGGQAVTGWALLPAYPLAVLGAVRRWPGITVVATALAGYQFVLARAARGRTRPDPAPEGSAAIRLVSANLLLSNPTITAAGEELRAEPVDILALQELTPEHLAGLRESGALEDLPYALIRAEPGFHGAALFSRWPLIDPEVIDLETVPLPVATVQTPDGPLRVVVVHAKNPGAVGELRRWQRQLRRLATLVGRSQLPTVLIGDFNATADHRELRQLQAIGLRDAYDIAGRGAGATWPVWPNLVPPLLRLDHALVSTGIAVRSALVRDTPGSDHRQLRVELRLTLDAFAPSGKAASTSRASGVPARRSMSS